MKNGRIQGEYRRSSASRMRSLRASLTLQQLKRPKSIQAYDPDALAICNCGRWMPATKEQARASREIMLGVVALGRTNNN
jgi:hypothetical protein